MSALGRDDDKKDERSPGGDPPALANLRATVRMAPLVRLKRPEDDEIPTAPQTRRGGSNIHDETTTKQRARDAGDETTQRRPSQPPAGPEEEPGPESEMPASIPRWDDESFPLAAARELARELEAPSPDGDVADDDVPDGDRGEAGAEDVTRHVADDDDGPEGEGAGEGPAGEGLQGEGPSAHDAGDDEGWDDVTVPRPRPPPATPQIPAPRAPRRVSTAAPHSADFPSLDKPTVVVSPVLTIDDPPPEPTWIERAPPTVASPTPEPRRWGPLLVVGLLLTGIAAVGLAFLL